MHLEKPAKNKISMKDTNLKEHECGNTNKIFENNKEKGQPGSQNTVCNEKIITETIYLKNGM